MNLKRWLSLGWLVGGLIFFSVGCGPGEVKSASATGKVTHQGQPVTEGIVHFIAPETGYSGSSALDATGSYNIAQGLPPASYKVYVAPPSLSMTPEPGTEPPPAKEYPTIPEKFRNEGTSGLSAVVKAGKNSFDFKLD